MQFDGPSLAGRFTLNPKKRFPGGMGAVYQAWDEATKSVCAVKIPLPSVNARIFEREARMLLGIEPHPNVVILQELERDQGRPILIMHFYLEGSLARWIGSPRFQVDRPLVLRLAIQICDGLLHARKHGVERHGDIKPGNVLMRNVESAALSDFGLALGRDDVLEGAGTPEYMAPELASGGAVSERTDVYAFGCTLYEMLSGAPPFGIRDPDTTREELRRRHRDLAPRTIDGLPDAVWQLVRDCLAKDAQERPEGFAAIRARLANAYRELAGVDAPPPMAAYDLGSLNWTMRGLGLCSLGRHDEETALHRKAVESDPRDAVAASYLAGNLRELGHLDEARRYAGRAIALDPQLPLALGVYGSVLDDLGESEEAERHFRTAIAVQPGYDDAWYNLGLALQRRTRWQEAAGCYRHALALQPRLSYAWTNLGTAYEELHEWRLAEEAYRSALHHEPCHRESLDNLSAMLLREGRHAERIQLLERVVNEC